jgi:hypothetical protein
MQQVSRAFRLRWEERSFLVDVMNQAIAKVQKRDVKLCVEWTTKLLHTNTKIQAKARRILRNVVLSHIASKGDEMFREMFNRHAAFKNLPKPLRGKALRTKAKELALVQRTKSVRIGTSVIREECEMAPTRMKLKMGDEIGRDCRRALVQEMKKKECVERVINEATRTGVANITILWRHFSASKANLLEMTLRAIKAVAKIATVHVLDIHGMTVLFPYPIFEQVLELLAPSYIFAINMGEDEGIFDVEHFQLLAQKIENGTSALRRWFIECHPKRRLTLMACGLVVNEKPNVFQLARRVDVDMWRKGIRSSTRLAWLLAPESAYHLTVKYKTAMQDSQCNWDKACAVRNKAEDCNSLTILVTVACMQ